MRVSLYRALPILPALLITLAGCASAPPTIQDFANRCAAMGYQPGSEALANCTERQATAWQLAHGAETQARGGALATHGRRHDGAERLHAAARRQEHDLFSGQPRHALLPV